MCLRTGDGRCSPRPASQHGSTVPHCSPAFYTAISEMSLEKVFGRHGDDIVDHLRVFTSKAIRQFLVHHGFDCVDVRWARFGVLPDWLRPVHAAFAWVPSLVAITVIAAGRR